MICISCTILLLPRVSVPFTDVGEDSVPVKYLQMSSTSPKVFKKNRLLSKGKSSSTPNSARGCRNGNLVG